MPRIGNLIRAKAYRAKAHSFNSMAKFARSTEDRAQLLRMRDAWSTRADHEDLVGGLPPLPPARALPVPANT
jgi:hypothetical protein